MNVEEVKAFQLPKRRQPVFSKVKKILRLFMRVKVEVKCEDLPKKAILLSNHSAKSGPLAFELYYPNFHVTWGAHEMLGNYKSRYLYLRNVFYIQKQGKSKFVATVKAAFEAIFSIFFYRGIKILPTYTDMRFLYTVRNSISVLEDGSSLLIFPENSSKGYFDELTSAFPGFVMLAEQYKIKTGEDVPIIPAYYHRKSQKIVVERPRYLSEFKDKGMSRNEIAEYFKEEINGIYRREFKDKVKVKDEKIPAKA